LQHQMPGDRCGANRLDHRAFGRAQVEIHAAVFLFCTRAPGTPRALFSRKIKGQRGATSANASIPPQPPAPSKNTTRRTINKVSMSHLTQKRSRTCASAQKAYFFPWCFAWNLAASDA
jgi:hypothetical protein